MPKFRDFKSGVHNMLFCMLIRKRHPEFDYYDYTQKLEYWALIIGIIIMGSTGFALWFPTMIGDWAPVWLLKVCVIIHFYEAVLATLSIILWHWFFVVFRPHKYPLIFTCMDGRITVTHYRDEHKLKFKKIIVEWLEVKSGKRDPKKLDELTKIFISSVEKSGVDFNDFILAEIKKDEQLRIFVEEKDLMNPHESEQMPFQE